MRTIRHGPTAIGLLTLLALGGTASAEPRGSCIRAEMTEPFVLPDGSVQPAGNVRICLERNYSPVAGLHEISIGKHTAGLYLSRRVRTEDPAESATPVLVFLREAGTLSLIGYTSLAGDDVTVYWLDAPKRAARDQLIASDLTTLVEEQPEDVLLVAGWTGRP